MSNERKTGHDDTGRKYAESLETRISRAVGMIGKMCSGRRPPLMSIPAGNGLHGSTCHDEDMFICDALEDASREIKLFAEVAIEKMPKTADGFAAYPTMILWAEMPAGWISLAVTCVHKASVDVWYFGKTLTIDLDRCHATHESAIAARNKGATEPALCGLRAYGYAPGNYMNKCGSCAEQFQGDKRAVRCKSCCEKMLKRDEEIDAKGEG